MEWLKDKKNQPIVAAIAVVVIIGVVIGSYFMFMKPSGSGAGATPPATTAPAAPGTDPSATGTPPPAPGTPPPAPGTPPAAPGTPGAPTAAAPGAAPAGAAGATATPGAASAATPAGGGGAKVASVTPMETWRGDPFQPIGYKAVKKVHVTAPIRDFPFTTLPGVTISRKVQKEKPEIQQPPRRMAGILLNDRVYAIIESGTGSEVVQPGDYLKDRLAMVQRIEPDKVVLKTVDEKPRYITVRMASSAHQAAPVISNSGPTGMAPMMPARNLRAPMAPGMGPPP